MAKMVRKMAAQGDVMIRRVAALPTGAKMIASGTRHVIAHSETGHHHVAVGESTFYGTDNPLVSYLVPEGELDVVHERAWDTHEALKLLREQPEGEVVWEIRRQRERSPRGWSTVQD